MRHSHSEIWTHLVLSTKDHIPVFHEKEVKIIEEALKDFAEDHEEKHITFSVLPEHIHILLKLPEDMSVNSLGNHLQTYIRSRLRVAKGTNSNFIWNKDFHAHSVSSNRLSAEKSLIERQHFKHQEISLKEELKFLGL